MKPVAVEQHISVRPPQRAPGLTLAQYCCTSSRQASASRTSLRKSFTWVQWRIYPNHPERSAGGLQKIDAMMAERAEAA